MPLPMNQNAPLITEEMETAPKGVVSDNLGLGYRLKKDFPILRNSQVSYLDTAASAQKPECVIDAVKEFYSSCYANIHRGVYRWSAEATSAFESTRQKVKDFLNARSESEIVFTKGATEAINLVAYSWARQRLKPGDEVVVTLLEHHSNFVPWQLACEQTGAKLVVCYPRSDGSIQVEQIEAVLSERTRLVAVSGMSNALGLRLPIADIVKSAHRYNALVLVDAAQLVVHERIDVQALDADFLVFSGHKLYGPSGVGVLYGKEKLLEDMPPFQSGGDMISSVGVDGTTFNTLPYKFEAGTPNIEGTAVFGQALDYFLRIDPVELGNWESSLVQQLLSELDLIDEVTVVGRLGDPCGLVSFVVKDIHPHDLSQILDRYGVAVRAGHHCAQPLMRHLGVMATTRASFGVYSIPEDVGRLVFGIKEALKLFS